MKRLLLAAVSGLAAALLAQAQVLVLWRPVYSRFPQEGYEYAMEHGMIDRDFMATPPTTIVTLVILFAIALLVLRRAGPARPLCAVIYFVTSALSLLFIVSFSPELRGSNFAPLVVPIIGFGCALAVGLAWGTAAMTGRPGGT